MRFRLKLGKFTFLDMAASLQLFTYPNNFRAQKALVAARYAGVDVDVPESFQYGIAQLVSFGPSFGLCPQAVTTLSLSSLPSAPLERYCCCDYIIICYGISCFSLLRFHFFPRCPSWSLLKVQSISRMLSCAMVFSFICYDHFR